VWGGRIQESFANVDRIVGDDWDVGGVECVQDRTQDATLGYACTHEMDRGHRVGLGYLVVSVGWIGLQDEEIGGR
jgi:hypothetical protein